MRMRMRMLTRIASENVWIDQIEKCLLYFKSWYIYIGIKVEIHTKPKLSGQVVYLLRR